jgi:hypothetical protein
MKDPDAFCPRCESPQYLTYDHDNDTYHCTNPEWYKNSNPQEVFNCDDTFTSKDLADALNDRGKAIKGLIQAAKKFGFAFVIGDRVVVPPRINQKSLDARRGK